MHHVKSLLIFGDTLFGAHECTKQITFSYEKTFTKDIILNISVLTG